MTSDHSSQPGARVRWRYVYAAVIAYTAVIVLLLWLFSRWFAG